MAQGVRKNGSMELKFNEDRTQALATIYPPTLGGDPMTVSEVLERLKKLGVMYGIREKAILDAIRAATENVTPSLHVVVAQGVLPQDGQDAKITYRLPVELLSKPLPKRADGSGVPDWFALDAAKLVKAEEELARVVPPQPGISGKTLTWPVQVVPPKAGKSCTLNAGQNVRISDDGLRLSAACDGYVCMVGEQLNVHALRLIGDAVTTGDHTFSQGAIFLGKMQQAQITASGIIAVKNVALACYLRAYGDVFVRYAENCTIIASGNVYVTGGLKNCAVNTRKKVIALESASFLGGKICATEGVQAVVLGAPDFCSTEIEVGVDRLSEVRLEEIQKELAACEANITRISQALKPFTTLAVHDMLPEDKRLLLTKLQTQKRSQEARTRDLHNEKRTLSIASKEKIAAQVTATRTVYPGVWITIHEAAMQVKTEMASARFVEGAGGKFVQSGPLQKAA